MSILEPKQLQISPFLIFFLVHSVQVGVGVLGFQRVVMKSAGNDAWIAVILAGIAIHITIWLMYAIMNRHKQDLVRIQNELFGKWIGGFFNTIWIIYWLLVAIIVLRSYLEIVQVWVFPLINIFVITFIFIILVYYCVSGGFRIVVGICFLGVIIPFYIYLTFLYPIEYANFRNLLPVFNHSGGEIIIASRDVSLSYLGFSVIFMAYPYIKNPKKSQKWAHFGNLLTTCIYLFIIIISICYFNEKQISHHIWATLSLWQIIEMPIVERFEYIGITSWLLIILPNICLSIWASTKALHEVYHIRQKLGLLIILFILLISTMLINSREHIDMVNKYMSYLGQALLYIYIPLLCILSFVIMKFRRKKS